jgi:hypothetical protein
MAIADHLNCGQYQGLVIAASGSNEIRRQGFIAVGPVFFLLSQKVGVVPARPLFKGLALQPS